MQICIFPFIIPLQILWLLYQFAVSFSSPVVQYHKKCLNDMKQNRAMTFCCFLPLTILMLPFFLIAVVLGLYVGVFPTVLYTVWGTFFFIINMMN